MNLIETRSSATVLLGLTADGPTKRSCTVEYLLKSWLLAVKSPVQSLDYHVNIYHIHLNNLEFHGYDKEISQKYPCSLQLINTSFLNTHSPSYHSPFPSSSSAATSMESSRTPTAKTFFLPESSSLQFFLLFGRKWLSTSSCPRLVHLHLIFLTADLCILANPFIQHFCFFQSFWSPNFRIWVIRLLFLLSNLLTEIKVPINWNLVMELTLD